MAAANETTPTEPKSSELLPPEPLVPASQEAPKKNGRFSSFFDVLKKKQQWFEVHGYHVGEIRTEFPVNIHNTATVVGNIYAPKIVVKGLLNGSAITKEIRVEEKGQIWGDVFTVTLTVEDGGKIQGWTSCVDVSDYEAMTNNAPSDEFEFNSLDLVSDTKQKGNTGILNRNEAPIETLQLLQAEVAAALSARAELEHDFEHRLKETYGESASTISTLKEQATSLRTELTGQKKQLDQTEETLRRTKEQADRQANELSGTYDLLSKQNRELSEFRESYKELETDFSTLLAEKEELDQTLADTLQQVDTLTARVNNLDAAHRASLQHSAEQEDSLLRWQELAEITEKKGKEIEGELEKLQFQMEERGGTIKLLRQQRLDLEEELEKAIAQLDELRERNTSPIEPPPGMADADKKIEELEAELESIELKYGEKILWHKAEVENSQKALDSLQEEMRTVQTQLATAQKENSQKSALISQLQEEVQTQQEKIAGLETAVAQNEANLEKQAEAMNKKYAALESEKKNLQVTIRETKAQLDAYEVEIERFEKATQNQGSHLAEIQSTLVERELQLKKARANLQKAKGMIDKQNEFIKHMKKVTGERIRSLQAQVAQLKQQS